jgi:hypothetical protein
MMRFSDFADEKPFKGDKICINDVLNKQIIIKDFRITPSKFNNGECVSMQIEYNGRDRVIFTGSVALANQCRKYEGKLPFLTTIIRTNRYYSMS